VPDLLLLAGNYRVGTSIVDHGHIHDEARDEVQLRVRGRGDDAGGLTRLPGSWMGPTSVDASPLLIQVGGAVPET
jgi:hypothetical protein